jgi:hypothetical protein
MQILRPAQPYEIKNSGAANLVILMPIKLENL